MFWGRLLPAFYFILRSFRSTKSPARRKRRALVSTTIPSGAAASYTSNNPPHRSRIRLGCDVRTRPVYRRIWRDRRCNRNCAEKTTPTTSDTATTTPSIEPCRLLEKEKKILSSRNTGRTLNCCADQAQQCGNDWRCIRNWPVDLAVRVYGVRQSSKKPKNALSALDEFPLFEKNRANFGVSGRDGRIDERRNVVKIARNGFSNENTRRTRRTKRRRLFSEESKSGITAAEENVQLLSRR